MGLRVALVKDTGIIGLYMRFRKIYKRAGKRH